MCRNFRLLQRFFVTAVKISILSVTSAFEWSLIYTRKPCCGRETALRRCKIQYLSKFTVASCGSPCDSTAFLLQYILAHFKSKNFPQIFAMKVPGVHLYGRSQVFCQSTSCNAKLLSDVAPMRKCLAKMTALLWQPPIWSCTIK